MSDTRTIAVADIGGTHARFALAEIADGTVLSMGEPVKMAAADHGSLQIAWEAFAEHCGGSLPDAAAIALAAPIRGDLIQLTNNPWIVRPPLIKEKLGLSEFVLINDFEAQAFAVAGASDDQFHHVTGPNGPLPAEGVVSVVGPGTGLGVAAILREQGKIHVLPTEGGHIDFAPLDSIDDRILSHLRAKHTRVSVERVVAGSGLRAIWEVLAEMENRDAPRGTDKELWTIALEGRDSIASAALDRFCMVLGSVVGDIALAHGPGSVVLAGGLGARLKDHLSSSGFADRFAAKGRYRSLMETIPVKLIGLEEPGLLGAGLAFVESQKN